MDGSDAAEYAILRGHIPKRAAQEQLQVGFIHALTAGAQCAFDVVSQDYQGIDCVVTHEIHDELDPSSAKLDLQLKATTQKDIVKADHIAFSLKKDLYDKLRMTKVVSPRLLVVMLIPYEVDNWLFQTTKSLRVRNCCYWTSLYDEPECYGATITTHVPLRNQFTVHTLCKLMKLVHADPFKASSEVRAAALSGALATGIAG